MKWRLLGVGDSGEPETRTGAANMALDTALLESVQAGGPAALRLYRWRPGCLSFGRNQHVRGRCDAAAARARGIDLVRRPTGGLAVHHDAELTYAVAVPVGALGSPRETYRRINAALVAGLRRLGVAAGQAAPVTAATPAPLRAGATVCFQEAAPGEVVVGGRKLIGSAQRCERRVVLQHGSILIGNGQELVAELMAPGSFEAARTATLEQCLDRAPGWPELTAAVTAGFEDVLGIRFAPQPPADAEATRARSLESQYASPGWTWRL